MPLLLGRSLWIDFTRARSPVVLVQFIAPFVLDPQAHLTEPVVFELLRAASLNEALQLEDQFATLPCLSTPPDAWCRATALGQACRRLGRTVASLDLLVAAVALHPNALLVTFDADLEALAQASGLRLQLLQRP